MFDQIEKLKRDFTDKYVIVDAKLPELKRFRDQVGLVKTVNMSGRALVEFQDYINNIGWYDIDLSFLKVVEKPPEKKVEAKEKPAKPAADKPTTEKAAVKPAAPQAAAPAAAGAKKQSVAEILAAARTKGGAPVAPSAPAKPAAAPVAKAEPGKKLSTADILAAARAKAAAGGAPAAPAKPAPVKKEVAPPPPVEEPAAEESAAEVAVPAPVAEKKPAAAQGDLPKTTAEIIAFCRRVDHDRLSRV